MDRSSLERDIERSESKRGAVARIVIIIFILTSIALGAYSYKLRSAVVTEKSMINSMQNELSAIKKQRDALLSSINNIKMERDNLKTELQDLNQRLEASSKAKAEKKPRKTAIRVKKNRTRK